jgi:hypothetical protein
MFAKVNFRVLLNGTAAFALAWVIARACVQAVTIDEAVSFNNFAVLPNSTYWEAHDNNHILNSIFMHLFTAIFGPTPLMVRAGAVIGAVIYVYASLRLARMIARENSLCWPLFACLVFNPLVFDFMVAARGYGLALGFLMSAIAVAASALNRQEARETRPMGLVCVSCSICGALSTTASFAFAFVAGATVFGLYLWIAAESENGTMGRLARRAQFLAACAVPGALTIAAIAGSALVGAHGLALVYGAESLRESLRSLAEASLYEPNPHIVNPLFYGLVVHLSDWLLPLLGLFSCFRLVVILMDRKALRDPHARWLAGLGGMIAGALALAFSLNGLLHLTGHVPWPKDRTAIYVVSLLTLLAGILAAIPIPSRAGEYSRRGLTAILFVLAGYFLATIRISYFKEWKWDSDVDKVYGILVYYNHTCAVKDVPVNWRYDAALNYYRIASRRETLANFSSIREYPVGKRAYVLYAPEDGDFIAKNRLTIVYEGATGAMVALNLEAPIPPGEHACEAVSPVTAIRS